MSSDNLPLSVSVASQFLLQVGVEGATLLVGQALVDPAQDEQGKFKPKQTISWHTQLFLSPNSLKKLAAAISESVNAYEDKIGAIPTENKIGTISTSATAKSATAKSATAKGS